MMKLVSLLLLAVAPLAVHATTPLVYSHSAVVYNVNLRQVLLEKNPDEVVPLASLTKLMTAMIVLDEAPALEETLTIDGADIDQLKHSRSRLPVGATLERKEMLRLALMSSENRTASALSRAIHGGQPAFIRKMNEKAKELDMAHTHFEDPTGLSPQNVSTARDVVKMADAASRYSLIDEFTTLSHYSEQVSAGTLFYRNTNPLIGRPGWDIQISKTGFTDEAHRCIVIEANMPNGPVIVVLMGARSSGMRSADLYSIRNWLEGNETPVATPRAYYVSTTLHHHKAVAGPRNSKVRLIAYSARSATNAHRPSGKHKTRKRPHSFPPSA